MMHIFTVVGARPQFIKCAPLSETLRKNNTEYLVHTGQHYDNEMSRVFFEELSIPLPDVNLNVGSGTHAEELAAMVQPLEKLMIDQEPDWVLVYGDTNSTLAGTLAASKLNIPIAHVEAGLRSFNRTMPEEINRVLTDHVSSMLFCPTPLAVTNLEKEGITQGVKLTGDIMVDSVFRALKFASQRTAIQEKLDLETTYGVMTVHRPSNTDNPEMLKEIVASINQLDIPLVFPMHPRTRKMMERFHYQFGEHVKVIPPLGYVDMLVLVRQAAVLMTDSGGLQKEAYVLKTPCITLRSETEWVETIDTGWNRLAQGSDLARHVQAALDTHPTEHPDLYGDGRSAQQIVNYLVTM